MVMAIYIKKIVMNNFSSLLNQLVFVFFCFPIFYMSAIYPLNDLPLSSHVCIPNVVSHYYCCCCKCVFSEDKFSFVIDT